MKTPNDIDFTPLEYTSINEATKLKGVIKYVINIHKSSLPEGYNIGDMYSFRVGKPCGSVKYFNMVAVSITGDYVRFEEIKQ